MACVWRRSPLGLRLTSSNFALPMPRSVASCSARRRCSGEIVMPVYHKTQIKMKHASFRCSGEMVMPVTSAEGNFLAM